MDFISSRKTEKDREAIREARNRILDKAEQKSYKEAERKKRENEWMLPDLEEQISGGKKRKKEKKEKKSKKHKKEKKKKRKRDRSSSSSESSEDEWVEKKPEVSKHDEDKQVTERDSWMNLGFSAQSSALFGREQKVNEKLERRQEVENEKLKKLAALELNTDIKKEHMSKIGDSWTARAVKRVYEQAKSEGKTVEEIAKKRFGSYEKFKSMEAKLENPEPKEESSKGSSSEITDRSKVSSSSGWKTKERRERDHERDLERHRDRDRYDRDRSDRDRSDRSDKDRSERKDRNRDSPERHQKSENASNEAPPKILTEEEMNKLGAKIIKFEMLGQSQKAAELKAKLEKAREAAKNSTTSQQSGTEEKTVILTRTDARGVTRPIEPNVPTSSRPKKSGKVQTHAEGQRVRYFADDDRYDLKEMFHREKMSTAEDQNSMMSRLAGKAIERTDDDDYSIDDLFTSRAAKKRSEEQDLAKERDLAIAEHKSMTRTLDTCKFCLEGSEFSKHLLVAMGKSSYVCLPWHHSLTEDHCFIVPIGHTKCSTLLDEDVYNEMQMFRKALVKMYEADDRDCVFYETAMGLKHHPHMVLECVPLPREMGELAPMYFQKAIQECESEWAHNKKLIKIEQSIRRSVPKGLPYFHVDFGLQNGFAHVIEDELEFPKNFAQGIIGGMLDVEPRIWRQPKREPFESQKKKVLAFGAQWKDFDPKLRSRTTAEEESSSDDNE